MKSFDIPFKLESTSYIFVFSSILTFSFSSFLILDKYSIKIKKSFIAFIYLVLFPL